MSRSKLFHLFSCPFFLMFVLKCNLQKRRYFMQQLILLFLLFRIQIRRPKILLLLIPFHNLILIKRLIQLLKYLPIIRARLTIYLFIFFYPLQLLVQIRNIITGMIFQQRVSQMTFFL